MKKLMIAAAIVCAAAVSQAAIINWTTTDILKGVDVAGVTDNGSYSGGGSNLKSNGTFTYTLTLFLAGEQVGEASGTVNIAGSKKVSTLNIAIADAAAGTAYDYTLAITGGQSDLRSKTSDTYDYSAATIASSQSGSITTAGTGATALQTASPATWTVSGITKEEPGPGPEPTPEPTSAMLMLLGMAGLALRRKQK